MMKLVKDASVRTYELTYLAPASLSESEVSTLKDKMVQLVARFKGKLVSAEDWGKKNLAYRLRHKSQHQTQAHYTHLVLEMTSNQAVAFEKEVYLENSIMRHLFVKVDDVKPTETKSDVLKKAANEEAKTVTTVRQVEKSKTNKKTTVPDSKQAKKE